MTTPSPGGDRPADGTAGGPSTNRHVTNQVSSRDDSATVRGGGGIVSRDDSATVQGEVGVASRDDSARGRGGTLAVGLGVGLAGTLGLGALGLTAGRHHLEQGLQTRTQNKLAEAGVRDVSISYSGRDATLRVSARMDAARLGQVISRTSSIRGVRVVHVVRVKYAVAATPIPSPGPTTAPAPTTAPVHTATMTTTAATTTVSPTQAPTQAPAGLRASVTHDVVVLSGVIPYEAIRPVLIATVSGARGVQQVRDLLEVDPVSSSDPKLLPGVASMMVALRNEGVTTGTATLANDTLTVTGRVATVAAHDRLLAWAATVMGDAIRVLDYVSVG